MSIINYKCKHNMSTCSFVAVNKGMVGNDTEAESCGFLINGREDILSAKALKWSGKSRLIKKVYFIRKIKVL